MKTKHCHKCETTKSVDQFNKDRSRKDGLQPVCRECTKTYWRKSYPQNAERDRKRARQRYWQNPDASWAQGLKQNYGMTAEQYEELYKKQSGVCAICGKPETRKTRTLGKRIKKLAVDHDHGTGKVRELLCHKCNMGLGSFNHDVELMEKAAAYVRRHQ